MELSLLLAKFLFYILVSVAEQSGLEPTMVSNTKTGFLAKIGPYVMYPGNVFGYNGDSCHHTSN